MVSIRSTMMKASFTQKKALFEVNRELQYVDVWFRANKMSLNGKENKYILSTKHNYVVVYYQK